MRRTWFIENNYLDIDTAIDDMVQSDLANTGKIYFKGIPSSFYFTRNSTDGTMRLFYYNNYKPVYGFKMKE